MNNKNSIKRKYRGRWIVLLTIAGLALIVYIILGRLYPEQNKQARTRLRETVKAEFPEPVSHLQSRYGFKPSEDPVSAGGPIAGNIILVHGLDDPGKVWMNLSPELASHGFRFWIFSYPDDQPIAESAQFFFREIRSLKGNGVSSVAVIAHSMGGLVAREMLTNPAIQYEDAADEGRAPVVSTLIMIGTPNHGAELAPLRLFTEFRDQLASMLEGDYVWIEGSADGAGEAGIDLEPGSLFLEELNGRPHPENLDMFVIAGVMNPSAAGRIDQAVERLAETLPESASESLSFLGNYLSIVVQGQGDGLVSVDSARLDGYPLQIVEGTHLSIIRNISNHSERVPPAVPVILEHLKQQSF
ncbi:MAG: alpha/beta fold hydrolase [Acidobacteriota bacterium]